MGNRPIPPVLGGCPKGLVACYVPPDRKSAPKELLHLTAEETAGLFTVLQDKCSWGGVDPADLSDLLFLGIAYWLEGAYPDHACRLHDGHPEGLHLTVVPDERGWPE